MEYSTNRFKELVENVKREGKENLIEHLKASGYFNAPCSSQYHLAEESGLFKHSVNVTDLMLDMADLLNCFEEDMTESIVICGLFHDLGKANYYDKPNYVENILKNGKVSAAKPYTTNKDRLYVPHEIASIHILSQFIKLTEEETFAILYHNGLYTSTSYSLKGNERPLQMILHFADLWSSRVLEREEE